MISALAMPCRYTEVMPRLACPSWRWITTSGTPSWAISTACACRSWCGANRRRTPANAAVRRSCLRAAEGSHLRPAVLPRMTHSNAPVGSSDRISSHGSSWSQARRSMPTSRRRPPLPRRTSTAPRRRSRSVSARSSASLIRNPPATGSRSAPAGERRHYRCQLRAERQRSLRPSAGQRGNEGPCCAEFVPGGSPASWLARGDDQQRPSAPIPCLLLGEVMVDPDHRCNNRTAPPDDTAAARNETADPCSTAAERPRREDACESGNGCCL